MNSVVSKDSSSRSEEFGSERVLGLWDANGRKEQCTIKS